MNTGASSYLISCIFDLEKKLAVFFISAHHERRFLISKDEPCELFAAPAFIQLDKPKSHLLAITTNPAIADLMLRLR